MTISNEMERLIDAGIAGIRDAVDVLEVLNEGAYATLVDRSDTPSPETIYGAYVSAHRLLASLAVALSDKWDEAGCDPRMSEKAQT